MRQSIRRALALLLCAALLLAAPGCVLLPDAGSPVLAAFDRTLFLMDTQMSLRVYGRSDGTGEACLDALADLLRGLDGTLSVTDPDSALSALNAGGQTADGTILALAAEAQMLSERTGGALDVSLYPASLLWGFTTGAHRVPGPDELEALRPDVGMEKLRLREDGLELADGMQLDFGALAKGWAADRCRALMEERGLSGILDLGGNIQTVGTKPDKTDWVVGIQDPDDPGAFLLTLTFGGSRAVVTSGDYQRYFEEGGVRYCHILDPDTLSPVQGDLRSVTVVAESGLLSDGLATALFVMGREKGLELWRQSGDFEAIFLGKDGTVTVTAGLKDLASGRAFEVAER